MKVYVKKNDHQKEYDFTKYFVIALALFFGSILVIAIDIYEIKLKYSLDIKRFIKHLACLILMGFIMYYFFSELFSRSKPYRVKLLSKNNEKYKNKDITYMNFSFKVIVNEKNQDGTTTEKEEIREYNCYTIGENNLKLNEEYFLYIKSLNYKAEYIEEIDEEYK